MCKAAAELGSTGSPPLSEQHLQTQGARGARCSRRPHPVLETASCPRVLWLLFRGPAEAVMLQDSLQTPHLLWIAVHRGRPVAAGCSRTPGTNNPPPPGVGSSLPADPRVVSGSEPHGQVCFLGGGFCHLGAIRQQRGAALAVCIPAEGAGWTPQYTQSVWTSQHHPQPLTSQD